MFKKATAKARRVTGKATERAKERALAKARTREMARAKARAAEEVVADACRAVVALALERERAKPNLKKLANSPIPANSKPLRRARNY